MIHSGDSCGWTLLDTTGLVWTGTNGIGRPDMAGGVEWPGQRSACRTHHAPTSIVQSASTRQWEASLCSTPRKRQLLALMSAAVLPSFPSASIQRALRWELLLEAQQHSGSFSLWLLVHRRCILLRTHARLVPPHLHLFSFSLSFSSLHLHVHSSSALSIRSI